MWNYFKIVRVKTKKEFLWNNQTGIVCKQVLYFIKKKTNQFLIPTTSIICDPLRRIEECRVKSHFV